MIDSLAGVALGAGSGTRMRPLTIDRPKVLLPVDGRPLIDHALDRLRPHTSSLAVNVHVSQADLRAHLSSLEGPAVEQSVESGVRLGTAGALAHLREWVDGRAVLVVNGDTWCPGGLDALLDGWSGETIRILVAGAAEFGPGARIAGALMPWADVRGLPATPSGLYEVSWRAAHTAGRLEAIGHEGPFVDCADPSDYLHANLLAAGGSSIGAGAVIRGSVEDSVVWDGAVVRSEEHLVRAIRTDTHRTVLIRR